MTQFRSRTGVPIGLKPSAMGLDFMSGRDIPATLTVSNIKVIMHGFSRHRHRKVGQCCVQKKSTRTPVMSGEICTARSFTLQAPGSSELGYWI